MYVVRKHALESGAAMLRAIVLIATAFLFAATSPAAAQAQVRTFGQWRVQTRGDFSEAFTKNESGFTFGLICKGKCNFYATLGKACADGAKYRAEATTQAGTKMVTLTCVSDAKMNFFGIDALEIAPLLRGDSLRLTPQFSKGRPTPYTYSLIGAREAIAALTDLPQQSQSSPSGAQ